MGRTAADPFERYRSKIAVGGPDECWPWTAGCFDSGYGAFRLGQKQLRAHRFGYEALVGPIPDGLCVLHTCDNPPCQNPAHWFVAHAHRAAKTLTEADVLAIRDGYRHGARQVDLAVWFGVSQTMISKVVRQAACGQLVDDGDGALESTSKYRHRLSLDDYAAISEAYRRGLTQAAVATRFGISQAMVSKVLHSG
jgi:hypothetical protein